MTINPKPGQMTQGSWTPNQVAKREQILTAACQVMLHDGVEACTARSVSAKSGLSTSAIHYYFKDTDEIFDRAFRRLMDKFFSHLKYIADQENDPTAALWAVAEAYLRRGSEFGHGGDAQEYRKRAPMLWFEFQAQSLRRGDMRTVQELSDRGAKFFTDLLEPIGVTNLSAMAETLFCALIGAAIRDSLSHQPFDQYVRTLMNALNLPAPHSRNLDANIEYFGSELQVT